MAKLDPKAQFHVYSLTRKQIAEAMNLALDKLELSPTDPRLTDEFCQGYVDQLYDRLCNTADEEFARAERDVAEEHARQLR